MALLGQTVVENLFGPGEDPVGATIRIKDVPFRVIGVLARKGQTTWGQDQDDTVVIPFSTAERRVLGSEILGTVDMVFVSAARAEDVLRRDRADHLAAAPATPHRSGRATTTSRCAT